MDQSFADFDFQSFPDEIQSKPAHTARPKIAYKSKPVTALSATFHVCGPQDKTQKRLRELRESLGADAIVNLELVPETDAEFEQLLDELRGIAVGLVSGAASVDIGDNHKQHKCPLKLSCSRCWEGEHGASHTTANWIICNLLAHIYTVRHHEIADHTGSSNASASSAAAADVWNVEDQEEDEEHGSYRYLPHELQDYLISAKPRGNANLVKIQNLFRVIIPGFFAGTTGMPRIGALRTPQFKNKNATDDKIWCKKPYCTRTLLATAIADRQGLPVCNKFHSDESSFLTSLLRILVECRKVARPVAAEPVKEKVKREPREPRVRKFEPAAASAPAIARNVFTLPDDDEDDKEDIKEDVKEVSSNTGATARLLELVIKHSAFVAKNADALKVNKSFRERRDKMMQQITAQRELMKV